MLRRDRKASGKIDDLFRVRDTIVSNLETNNHRITFVIIFKINFRGLQSYFLLMVVQRYWISLMFIDKCTMFD